MLFFFILEPTGTSSEKKQDNRFMLHELNKIRFGSKTKQNWNKNHNIFLN